MTKAERLRALWQDPDYRARMARITSESMKRRWADPAFRERLQTAQANSRPAKPRPPLSADARAKISAAHKGKPKTPEHRAAISRAMLRVMDDESERGKRAKR